MVKYILSIMAAIALTGCAQNNSKPTGRLITDIPVEERINVPGIKEGMTRDEVIFVLGDNYVSDSSYFDKSTTPPTLIPIRDSFLYENEDGQPRYAHIMYIKGLVVQAIGDQDTVYIYY